MGKDILNGLSRIDGKRGLTNEEYSVLKAAFLLIQKKGPKIFSCCSDSEKGFFITRLNEEKLANKDGSNSKEVSRLVNVIIQAIQSTRVDSKDTTRVDSKDTTRVDSKDTTRVDSKDTTITPEPLKDDYTLSKEDFIRYFEGANIQQQNIGDCWLLSTMNCLVSYGGFEELIRKSVQKTYDGFKIITPLGSPKGEGKEFNINYKDLSNQKSIYGDNLNLVKAKDGIKAIMIAYGKLVTGKDTFDLMNLDGGFQANAFNTLIHGMNVYGGFRENTLGKRFMKKFLGQQDSEFLNGFRKIVETFNPENELLSISVKQGGKYEELLACDIDLRGYVDGLHALSVKNKFYKGGVLYLTISNPWDCSKSYDISFEDLMNSCFDYTLGTKKDMKDLSKYGRSDIGNRQVSRNVSSGKEDKAKSLNEIIQLSGGTEINLVGLVEFQLFSGLDTEQQLSRGDVVIEDRGGIYYVKCWGKDDTYIIFDENLNPKFKVGDYTLNLEGNKFSNAFKGNTKDCFKWYLYPPRLMVFINKMRHDYIDTVKGNPANKFPFSIGTDGGLMFDDNLDMSTGLSYYKRLGSKKLGDGKVNVLKSWDMVGINPGDSETKEKIVALLNQLYSKSA